MKNIYNLYKILKIKFRNNIIVLLAFVSISLSFSNTLAQQNTTQPQVNAKDLKIYFIKRFIEILPPGSIFNILVIKNNSTTEITLNTVFTFPDQWSLIGQNNVIYKVAANDSLIIPLRLSVSSNSRGGVANVIGVNILDEKKKTVGSAFCYANIIKKPNLLMKKR